MTRSLSCITNAILVDKNYTKKGFQNRLDCQTIHFDQSSKVLPEAFSCLCLYLLRNIDYKLRIGLKNKKGKITLLRLENQIYPKSNNHNNRVLQNLLKTPAKIPT